MECHSGSVLDRLSRLMKTIIGSLPIENPHPEQRQESWIIDLRPIHLLKPLCPLDHVGPESIIEEQVQIHVPPPSIVGSLCILPS